MLLRDVAYNEDNKYKMLIIKFQELKHSNQKKSSIGAGEVREMHLFVQTGTQHSQYSIDWLGEKYNKDLRFSHRCI